VHREKSNRGRKSCQQFTALFGNFPAFVGSVSTTDFTPGCWRKKGKFSNSRIVASQAEIQKKEIKTFWISSFFFSQAVLANYFATLTSLYDIQCRWTNTITNWLIIAPFFKKNRFPRPNDLPSMSGCNFCADCTRFVAGSWKQNYCKCGCEKTVHVRSRQSSSTSTPSKGNDKDKSNDKDSNKKPQPSAAASRRIEIHSSKGKWRPLVVTDFDR